eukprot:m.257676 g.257676  ORF g.257676 m.257676 type:complete len:52 (+) comp26757_c2_seq1:358-513(+)
MRLDRGNNRERYFKKVKIRIQRTAKPFQNYHTNNQRSEVWLKLDSIVARKS